MNKSTMHKKGSHCYGYSASERKTMGAGSAANLCLRQSRTPIPVTDLSLSCGGMEYILRVRPTRKRKLAVLQAIGISPDTAAPGGKRYELIKDGLMLSALPEIILYQGGSVCSA